MIQERTIIHLDIADFAASVESMTTPSLAGRPLAIALSGSARTPVYDMSEAAFQQGIRKGMALGRARRRCRDVQVLPPRFHWYEKMMKALLKISSQFSPLIESGTQDGHLYLDVTGMSRLAGPGVDIAFRLKKTFKKEFGLEPVWSVAANKLVAKVATRLAKPFGEYIVPPGEEADFLSPLPLDLLPVFSQGQIRQLHRFNLNQVSQARELTCDQLELIFASHAPKVYNALRGKDMDPVPMAHTSGYKSERVSQARTLEAGYEFAADTNEKQQLEKGVFRVCEKIGHALRQEHLAAVSLKLTLSYSDGKRAHAGSGKFGPTISDFGLFKTALPVLENAWRRRVRIQYLHLQAKGVNAACIQTALFGPEKRENRLAALSRTMDQVRKKFGKGCIGTGLALATESQTP